MLNDIEEIIVINEISARIDCWKDIYIILVTIIIEYQLNDVKINIADVFRLLVV